MCSGVRALIADIEREALIAYGSIWTHSRPVVGRHREGGADVIPGSVVRFRLQSLPGRFGAARD
jgi:hypothetical protein